MEVFVPLKTLPPRASICDCSDSISGTITTNNPMCPPPGSDFGGIEVIIIDEATGLEVAGSPVITDAMGNYSLAGPFPCGLYSATLVEATLPTCYTSLDGETGPVVFSVDGDGAPDGIDFSNVVGIPTLSQWGLISLALLLMIMGSLKLGFSTTAFQSVRKK